MKASRSLPNPTSARQESYLKKTCVITLLLRYHVRRLVPGLCYCFVVGGWGWSQAQSVRFETWASFMASRNFFSFLLKLWKVVLIQKKKIDQ